MNRPRILVADDHKEMRAIIVSVLEPEFQVVGEVASGQDLLNAESQLKPDICVVDIAMPEICGIEAAAKLRMSGSKTKVVILTIYDDRDYQEAALISGAVGYVVKSRILSDLSEAIHQAVGGRQLRAPSKLYANKAR